MTKKKDNNLTISEALSSAWKKRKDFLNGEPRGAGTLHNVWRSKVFTARGKKLGFPLEWVTFKGFKDTMSEGFENGLVLISVGDDYTNIKNYIWAKKGSENFKKCVKLTYKGETLYLYEWAERLNLNYNGLKQRYSSYKNTTIEQILFGKRIGKPKTVLNKHDLDKKEREFRIKRMLSSYRAKDKKRGFDSNVTLEYLSNIVLNSECTYCGTTAKIGLDRIDNSKGHTIDNTLPCCNSCNITRGDRFTVDEMKQLGETIKQINNARERKNNSTK